MQTLFVGLVGLVWLIGLVGLGLPLTVTVKVGRVSRPLWG